MSLYVKFSNFFIYRNLCVMCKNFGWLVDDFFVGNVNLCSSIFLVVITGILYLLLLTL